ASFIRRKLPTFDEGRQTKPWSLRTAIDGVTREVAGARISYATSNSPARLSSAATFLGLIDSTSLARAAVSYSSRHSAFSRTATSARRHSRSSSGGGTALRRSAGSAPRSRSQERASASQRRRRQNARNERTVATCRFQVAGAQAPHAAV